MSVKTLIRNNSTKHTAEVAHSDGEKQGLVVATRELKQFTPKGSFFVNDTYGVDMNQDVGFSGTPDYVHNGLDNVYWTGSVIIGVAGDFVFNSTTQAHTGTQSIDCAGSSDGETMQLAKGSDLTVANYAAFSGWIYITAWSVSGTKEVELFGWDTGTGTQIGNTLSLSDYIDTATTGSWQQFVIPRADFGFTADTIDALRVRTVDIGPAGPPDYYLDDLQFEEVGAPLEYKIEPDEGTWLYIPSVTFTFVDAYDGTLADSPVPKLPYDTILGLAALSIGVRFTQQDDINGVTQTFIFKKLIDMIQMPGIDSIQSGTDGTNTWLTIRTVFQRPMILKSEENGKLSIFINDDMTGLLFFRISAVSYEESRL